MRYDVVVLGGGIVGVSTALHLQAAGQRVALIDRREPGEETSHGNAGIIERDGYVPLTLPNKITEILKYMSNRQVAMHYHPTFMPKMASWLWRMWRLSNPAGIDIYAQGVAPLRANAILEHEYLARDAGVMDEFRYTGWINLYHSAKSFAGTEAALRYADMFGIDFEVLGMDGLEDLEPHVDFSHKDKGILWKGCVSVPSPKRITKAYAALFAERGGDVRIGEALSLKREGDDWTVSCTDGSVSAPKVVVALGPWSMDLLKPMGYRLPLATKRGYHQHFASLDGAVLNRPIVDEDIGFLMTPTDLGIRLTSGIEFAPRDARKTPTQIYRAADWARHLYPLGAPVEDEPWMGARPCFPDSLPVIDQSDRDVGLYFNFGHGHMGFGTGPVTGRLMADMVLGKTPSISPSPFSAKRF
ncbi:NAD(P)/FAD-dependent oxidoreductase [Cohaesibacter celericrescens]|nr:FAD-binding oxidoreductase [Cohaesibacter celericrescens]